MLQGIVILDAAPRVQTASCSSDERADFRTALPYARDGALRKEALMPSFQTSAESGRSPVRREGARAGSESGAVWGGGEYREGVVRSGGKDNGAVDAIDR